jgi:hypothetical protein
VEDGAEVKGGAEQRQAIIQDFLPHFRRYLEYLVCSHSFRTSCHISEGIWNRTDAAIHSGLLATFQKVFGIEPMQPFIQDFLPHFRRHLK